MNPCTFHFGERRPGCDALVYLRSCADGYRLRSAVDHVLDRWLSRARARLMSGFGYCLKLKARNWNRVFGLHRP